MHSCIGELRIRSRVWNSALQHALVRPTFGARVGGERPDDIDREAQTRRRGQGSRIGWQTSAETQTAPDRSTRRGEEKERRVILVRDVLVIHSLQTGSWQRESEVTGDEMETRSDTTVEISKDAMRERAIV